ncbi:MAG: RluA family pseudouridine synthase [Acidobacteriota bacterium]
MPVVYFEPQPAASELPDRFPSPFASEPCSVARRAAGELVRELEAGLAARLALDAPGHGKMFGVLVVADRAGRLGYLRAFSGMVSGRWDVPGFAPPVFDAAAREAFWPAGECELAGIDARLAAAIDAAAPARAALAALEADHDAALAALRERHRERRRRRHEARSAGSPGDALDRESRADGTERRRFDAEHALARAPLAARADELAAAQRALEHERAARSRYFLHRIHATYALASADGETRSLGELFAPVEPPGGAGDCAAPKLLALAYREGLRPLALAELWWGAPPATGGRHAGVFYPACRGKCGPILAHMLRGLAAEPVPVFGGARIAADEPRTIFEDRWLAVVAKPPGLLSVPGRGGALRDSVLSRLRARYPEATGPLLVHRLDLDASGLLLCAKDAATHAALQRLFALREIDKRYIAWLDGAVAGEAGCIELPLRVDLDDRPRQIVDPVHGKPALTEWRVLAREPARTRVALCPRTGRAHQLRVHAAHPGGLAAPIAGDRLYGRGGERLLLHAEHLAFVHPHTGERVELADPAPF